MKILCPFLCWLKKILSLQKCVLRILQRYFFTEHLSCPRITVQWLVRPRSLGMPLAPCYCSWYSGGHKFRPHRVKFLQSKFSFRSISHEFLSWVWGHVIKIEHCIVSRSGIHLHRDVYKRVTQEDHLLFSAECTTKGKWKGVKPETPRNRSEKLTCKDFSLWRLNLYPPEFQAGTVLQSPRDAQAPWPRKLIYCYSRIPSIWHPWE